MARGFEDRGVFLHGGELLDEGLVFDEALLVLRGAALGHDGLEFVLLQTLAEGEEDVLQLGVHHGAVLGLVVELEHLDEVLVATGVLVGLHLGEDGQEVVDLELLHVLLLLAAHLGDHGQGRVEVQGAEGITEVVSVELYDKSEDGTMMYAELEHILLTLGERLEKYELEPIMTQCCPPEDEEGFVKYEPFVKKLTTM